MSAYLSPIGGAGWQFFANDGEVLAGGKLYTYVAGSTTPQSTWTDSTQAVLNANPLILDSSGRPSTEIWLTAGTNNYKFVLKDEDDVQLGSWDNITGISTSNSIQSEWVASELVVTYVSASSFSAPGNQTSVFLTNRRVQYFLGSGTFYGSVVSSNFSAGVTTVVVAADSTALDNTLSGVNYGYLTPVDTSIPAQYIKQGDNIDGTPIGQSVPAAGTFSTLTSANVNITGGSISGIAGFSVPDYLKLNQGVQ